jgi:alkylation response protein AidB-like acyl-CoA dehydrogenase
MILNEQQAMIRDMARAFAQEKLAPKAAEWDKTCQFPKAELQEMGKLGFLGITVPEDWGGAGTDMVCLAAILEELAAGDAGTATIVSGHNSVCCMPIVQFGTIEQKERFLRPLATGEWIGAFALTEAHGGSEAGALNTKAMRKGDHYVLNGVKQFITTGQNADIVIAFAKTQPELGPKGISAFIVPTSTPGYKVMRVESKMGQHSSDTCQIAFEDMALPATYLLGQEGQGYRIALANLESGRIGIGAQAVGIARAAYELAVQYARERQVFGKAIIDHQAVGFRIARMASLIEAARQLVLHSAALKDAGQPCLMEACMAKLEASETAERVCSDAIQTLAGYGYLTDYAAERLYRDARVTKIYEGTNDIQHLVILRELQRRMTPARI